MKNTPSNTEKAENIIKGLLAFCEPSEVINAVRNELYHNEAHFGDYTGKLMVDMKDALEKAAKVSHKMLHG
jgi:hypothetical protein